MRICVLGLWHLGTVTAACLAKSGHTVVGCDEDSARVSELNKGKPPVFEPGLAELVTEQMANGRLQFSGDATQSVEGADVVWITFDTPVNEDDIADVEYVLDRVKAILPHIKNDALVLISSQLPVGSTRLLAEHHQNLNLKKRVGFGCIPENLRLGKAIDVFMNPDRVVVGLMDSKFEANVREVFKAITEKFVFMSVESAEMTKHAINGFLAVSVSFANEIATICERLGADAQEVAKGLKTESRIGPGAYVSPGTAFSGGTLARDIVFLSGLAQQMGLQLPLIGSVRNSNDNHRYWPFQRLKTLLGDLTGRRITILGLTYKPGTDTLRRSYSLELAAILAKAGAVVTGYDPQVSTMPSGMTVELTIEPSLQKALQKADAAVLATEWPQFRNEPWQSLAEAMNRPVFVDPKGFLADQLSAVRGLVYSRVGLTIGDSVTKSTPL